MANTTNLTIAKPIPGGSGATWGTMLNTALDTLDALFGTSTGHEHTGAAGEGPKLAPLALAGVVTTNVGLLCGVSDATTTPRTLTAGSGIAVTNGTGVAGNPTVAVDIPGLTNETAIAAADTVMVYDASAAALREATRDNLVKSAVSLGHRLHQAMGTLAANPTIDVSSYSSFDCTANAAWTWTISNAPASGIRCEFSIQLYSTGIYTQVWPASVKWANASAAISSANKYMLLKFATVDGGTTWIAYVAADKAA